MATLKQQLYQEAANKSLGKLRLELRSKYKPKKDGRFFSNGITYEIGVAKASENGISFDISSKIPVEILPMKSSKDKYFKLIKKTISKDKKNPESIEMDSILTTPNGKEIKERDYIKVIYHYDENELFDDKSIQKEMELIKSNKKVLPQITGVNSISGRLILMAIEESIYKMSNLNISLLIKSNTEVMKEYTQKKKSTAK
jgi:hypothetical protein